MWKSKLSLKAFIGGSILGTSCALGYYMAMRQVRNEENDVIMEEFLRASSAPNLIETQPKPPKPKFKYVEPPKVNKDKEERWDYNWDRKKPELLVKPLSSKKQEDQSHLEKYAEELDKANATAQRNIILIRHGQYVNEDRDEDRHLTKTGEDQAQSTGVRLKELLKSFEEKHVDKDGNKKPLKINLVFSTMTRARETAEIIIKELNRDDINISHTDLIQEGAPIPPVPPVPKDLWNPEPWVYLEEGTRIEAAFRKYIQRADADETIDQIDILVCHGNVIRYFICRALQFPPDAWLRFGVRNGSISSLYLRPSGRVGISTIGESGHMTPDLLTFN